MTVRSSSASPLTTSGPSSCASSAIDAGSQVVAHEREVDALAGEFGHVDRRARHDLRLLASAPAFSTCSTVWCSRSASASMMS